MSPAVCARVYVVGSEVSKHSMEEADDTRLGPDCEVSPAKVPSKGVRLVLKAAQTTAGRTGWESRRRNSPGMAGGLRAAGWGGGPSDRAEQTWTGLGEWNGSGERAAKTRASDHSTHCTLPAHIPGHRILPTTPGGRCGYGFPTPNSGSVNCPAVLPAGTWAWL